MKYILKYLSAIAIIFTFFSCEEESNFQDPNIALVPVYTITDIQGTDAPFKLNIYREKDLIIEYTSEVNVLSFESSNYSDTSNDTNYNISVDKLVDGTPANYVIVADKITGEGTMTIDSTVQFDITISEIEVYN